VKLPAGAYTIQEEPLDGLITIRNSAGRTVVLLSGPGVQTAGGAAPSLTFVNVGGAMVLTSVNDEGRPSRMLPLRGIVP
jgi:hypothetical protein